MEDRWDFYPAKVDYKPASIYLNFGYRNVAPIAGVEHLVWLCVYFQNPRDDGLSHQDEAETLFAIEDSVQAALNATGIEHHYVGRNTSDGSRDFYIYCTNSDAIESALSDVMAKFPQYEFETGTRHEADWSAYRDFLYPSPRDMQLISNQHLLEHLKKSHDSLATPRRVQHWSYFSDMASRSKFIAKAQALGFKLDYQIEPDEDDSQAGCVVFRTHACDADTIQTVTLDLFDLAIEFDGRYDGWETPVVRSDDD